MTFVMTFIDSTTNMKTENTSLKAALGAFPLPSELYADKSIRRAGNDTDALARGVLAQLEVLYPGAPFLTPKQIGPILGITDNGFTKYCRASRHLKLWKGSYRFYTDDPEHMAILKKVVGVVLCSGIKVPADLRPAWRGASTLVQ